MSKEDFLKLGLTEEQAVAAASAVAETLKGYVSKTDYDKVSGEKGTVETALSKLTADHGKLTADHGKLTDDHGKLTAAFNGFKLDNAVEKAVLAAKGKSVKAVKAFLKLDGAEFDEAGGIKGLKEQIDALAKDTESAFLFGGGASPAPNASPAPGGGLPGGAAPLFTGVTPAGGTDGLPGNDAFLTGFMGTKQ